MKQQTFEQRHKQEWTAFTLRLSRLNNKKLPASAKEQADFPKDYRQICQQLAVAQERQYSPYLIDRLNHMALEGHQFLYGTHSGIFLRMSHFLVAGFPRLIRQEARFFWASTLLFMGPLLVVGLGVYLVPELVYSLLDYDMVHSMEEMYNPSNDVFGRERSSDSDMLMFGFYIKHNIGIGFQTFSGGLLYGLGSIFYLVFNGVVLGAVAGHLSQIGYTTTFYSFVIGHGAFELTAIVLCGAAGLKLGDALLSPGRWSRLEALRQAGRVSIQIVYGAIGMLVIAAFLEAFWSSSTYVPAAVKFAVGALLWIFVAFYFSWLGRVKN